MGFKVYVNPTDALAMAIFMFEGGREGKPLVMNIRNNNPGNLRPFKAEQKNDGRDPDFRKCYRVFDTFIEGWEALLADLNYKIDKHPELKTIFDIINRYAPAGDANNPTAYATFVCGWLTQTLGYPVSLLSSKMYVFRRS